MFAASSVEEANMMTLLMALTPILTLLCLLLPSSSSAEERTLPKFSARVELSVSSSEQITGEGTSYLSRELRSLPDVTIVEQDPDWLMSVVALEVKTKGGYTAGVAISIVILKPYKTAPLKVVVGPLTPDKEKLVDMATTDLYSYQGQWLRTGASSELKELCQGIIADFDSKHLDKDRKFHQEMIDIFKKR